MNERTVGGYPARGGTGQIQIFRRPGLEPGSIITGVYWTKAGAASERNNRHRWLWVPWVHDTSATPARVLWRWESVMASSALRSGLRSTACMQAVDLKNKLHLRLIGRGRRLVGSCGATRSPPRSGRAAMSLSGLSNWPSAGGGGMAASSWRARRTCGTAWAKALRWD